MKRNFDIQGGIYLKYSDHELDLHNDYDFLGLNYSIENRNVILNWKRSKGDWVNPDIPESLSIEFSKVSEFRFMPRDSEIPFTEDDCLNSFGYWVDEEWADGVVILNENQNPDPSWLTALDFMSGAVIAIQSESANVVIMA